MSGCLAVPAAALSVAFEPIQSGTGDPSPTNVRPISGRTEVNLDTEGRNIWDEEWELGDINGNTGQDLDSSDYIRSSYIKVSLASLYMRTPTTIRKWIYFYDKNKQYLGDSVRIRGNTNETFSLPTNAGYIRFLVAVSEYGSSTYMNNICINVSDPDFNGQYVPYKGSVTLTIALGQTVYGSNLDVKTGVLTSVKGFNTFTGASDENWIMDTNNRMYIALSNCYTGDNTWDAQRGKALSNIFGYNTNIYNQDNTGYYIAQGYLYVRVSGITTVADFKTWLASHNLQVCYELATPTTVQLTPAQLMMLKGYNSLSTDGGDVITVTAYAINEEVGA